MKKLWICLIATPLISIASLPAWAKEIQMKVYGMTCELCAKGIEKTFKKEPGVTDVKVDLDNKIVVVSTSTGVEIPDERLKKLITDAGYELKEVKRDGK
jgi:copper chaperone CopZ